MRSFIKERWFNYRPLSIIMVFLALGSIFAFYITNNVVITIICTIVVLSLSIFIAILKKKIKYFLIPLISFIIGISAYFISIKTFETAPLQTPDIIEARIYSVDQATDGRIRVYADSVKFDGSNQNAKVTIYIYDYTNMFGGIEIGSVIRFEPINVYKSDLFYSGIPNSYTFTNNLKYSITVNISNIELVRIDKTFAEKIREYIKENLHNGLTNENVEIAYSALFGDKALLSDDQYDVYRLSGVAHLLAVSGLHVGIIVGIIYWILDRLKVKGWKRVIIVAFILLLYAYICGFTVSVVRAMIMTLVMLIAPLMFRQYDSISSISLAGIIVYFINPLSVFDVSTLMSFSCVFGIALLYRPIFKALFKIKLPNILSKSLAMSCSTTISLIFIMAYFFKTFNLISVLANIILIPLFTIGFTIVFVLSIISLIVPFITYLLVVVNPIFDFINLVATILGNLSISNFETMNINYISIFIYFFIIMLISRMCTAEKEHRVMISLPLVALLVVSLV